MHFLCHGEILQPVDFKYISYFISNWLGPELTEIGRN
jgi:hypothetical protein